MTTAVLVDAEDVVTSWLKTTSVNTLVGGNVFIAVPKGNPLPCVVLYQSGGAPAASHVPYEEARISFSCWSNSRPQAKAIAVALVNEVESLSFTQAPVHAGGRIVGGVTLSKRWLPDPVSDTKRYAIDCRFSIVAV